MAPCRSKRGGPMAANTKELLKMRVKPRHVSFGDVQVLESISPRSDMSLDERRSRWYQKEHYRRFRKETNEESSHFHDVLYRQKLGLHDYIDDEDDDEFCMRGLERRMSTKRQRLKDCVIREILSSSDSSQLCSSWATAIAIKTARNDYNSVYHPCLEEHPCDLYSSIEASLQAQPESSDEEVETTRRKRGAEDGVTCRPKRQCTESSRRLAAPVVVRRRRIPMWQPESWVTVP